MHALERAFTTKGDWANLYATYERALKVVVGDSNQADIYAKMARLSSEHLGEPEKAVELWKQVLDLRGEDPEALRALGQLYTAQGNWRDLVDILEREASGGRDRRRAHSHLHGARPRLVRHARARAQRTRELRARARPRPGPHAGAVRDRQHPPSRRGATQELVDTLHRIIDVGREHARRRALEARLHGARPALRAASSSSPPTRSRPTPRAVDVNPRNFAAMDALERIHTEQGDWEARIGVKERRVTGLERRRRQDRRAARRSRTSWTDDGGAARSGRQRAHARARARSAARVCVHAARDDLHRRRALGARWSSCTWRASRPSKTAPSASSSCTRWPRSTRPSSTSRSRRSTRCSWRGPRTTSTDAPPISSSASRRWCRAGISCSPRPTKRSQQELDAGHAHRHLPALRQVVRQVPRASRLRDPVLPADPAARSRAPSRP